MTHIIASYTDKETALTITELLAEDAYLQNFEFTVVEGKSGFGQAEWDVQAVGIEGPRDISQHEGTRIFAITNNTAILRLIGKLQATRLAYRAEKLDRDQTARPTTGKLNHFMANPIMGCIF